jgi:hypothetical protein
MTKLEIWKPIQGFENLYEVSNLGNVKSLDKLVNGWCSKKLRKEKLIKPTDRRGYLIVGLSKEGYRKYFSVHRLVAMAFIPYGDFSLTVNHKDGNKQNNLIENLEWCTRSEQMKHAIKTGLFKPISPRERGYVVTPQQYEKGAKKRQKAVICLTDDFIFNSVKEAIKYARVSSNTFLRNVKFNKPINGKYYKYKENNQVSYRLTKLT